MNDLAIVDRLTDSLETRKAAAIGTAPDSQETPKGLLELLRIGIHSRADLANQS